MKERLDKLIVRRQLLESRERAKAFIMAGSIQVNGETIRTPSKMVDTDAEIGIRVEREGYVSRGGIKLEKAIDVFHIEIKDAYCIDIGSSTGGFIDCLLKRGARKVIAVDVGKNQIDYTLRKDPRVEVREGFNARYIDRMQDLEPPDIVTIDVSFISVRHILIPLRVHVTGKTSLIVLVKPQFELDRPYPGFTGVVRNAERHRSILESLCEFFQGSGYGVRNCTFSPIRGPKGNIEYFVHLQPYSSMVYGSAHEFTHGSDHGLAYSFAVTRQKLSALVSESYRYFNISGGDGDD
jgi:23S rRNA (cytidine1920-2'-O)/16S rRNA (cytidine1409-2'-O)-methyltransferase